MLIIIVRAVGFATKKLGSAVYFPYDLAMLQLFWASVSPPAKVRGLKMTRDSSTLPLHESVETDPSLASSELPCGQGPSQVLHSPKVWSSKLRPVTGVSESF